MGDSPLSAPFAVPGAHEARWLSPLAPSSVGYGEILGQVDGMDPKVEIQPAEVWGSFRLLGWAMVETD